MKRLILAAVLAGGAAAAVARNETGPGDGLEPPELPPPSYEGETVEPAVTIIETEQGLIHEYRLDGRLYMVKVQPQTGPSYYLLDTMGDGQLDTREDRAWSNGVPQWVLFRW